MNLKFRILKYANNIDPLTFDCDAVASVISLSSLNLLIQVDGDEVFNGTAGTITTGSNANIVTGTGFTVDFLIEDTDYFVINIDNAIEDINQVRLRFSDETSFVYDQTFDVYDFDIGKNPNDSFPVEFENVLDELDFYLIPNRFFNPGIIPYNTVCTKIYNYRQYGGDNKLHVLKTSSGYYTALEIKTPAIPIGDGTILSTSPYVVLLDPKAPDGTNYTSIDVGTTGGLGTTYKNFPIKGLSTAIPLITYTFADVSCLACNCAEDGMSIGIVIEGTTLDGILQNLVANYHNLTTVFVVFNLRDMTDGGAIVDTDSDSVVANPAVPWVSYPRVYTPAVSIEWDKYYQLDIELRLLTIDGDLVSTQSIELLPCSYSEFLRDECGTWAFTSKGGPDRILRIYQVNNDEVETLVTEYESVQTNDTLNIELTDGVYFFKMYNSSEELLYIYKAISICAIENCIVNTAKALACQDPCAEVSETDCGCGSNGLTAPESLAVFHLLVFNLLNLINEVYQTSYIVETLTEADATIFGEMSTLIERLSNYCEGC